MFAIYITHPQVHIDPNIVVAQWPLSQLGRERALKTSQLDWVKDLGRIISSDEVKAVETANIFAVACGLKVEVVDNMGENDRTSTGFMSSKEFEKAADQFLAYPEQSFKGWERAADAQDRIVRAITNALDEHDKKTPIAFVGHGAVGTLFKSHIAGTAVSRQSDQPAGGGNLFAFDLAHFRLACDWTPMESWKGWC